MFKGIYIGLAALTGVTFGALLGARGKRDSLASLDSGTEEDSFVVSPWNEEEKQTSEYKQLLSKWGTKEGVIDVNAPSELLIKKRKASRFKKVHRKGKVLSEKFNATPKIIETVSKQKYHEKLVANFETTQVTITNNTSSPQKVNLWGANSAIEDHSKTEAVEEFDSSTRLGTHPQNAIYNPANNLFYIVNQLSDSLSVLNAAGVLLRTLDLGNGFIGTVSPADLTVNTVSTSSSFGVVYLIGSVSNTVYEIDLNFKVTNDLKVGKRPIAIAFNQINESIYVCNLVSNTVSEINTLTKAQSIFTTLEKPVSIGVHQGSGNVYVFQKGSQSIRVFDTKNKVLAQGISINTANGKFGYNPNNKRLYFSVQDQNQVIALNDIEFNIDTTIAVGNSPLSIAYNSVVKSLYVSNILDQNYSLVSDAEDLIDTIKFSSFNIGLAISTIENTVLNTSITEGSAGLKKTTRTPAISFNDDYQEHREDFQHNPAILQHLRVINSGNQKLNTLQLINKSISGKEECVSHSFRNYDSPQNFANVSELYDVKGAMLDGRNSWCLSVPPNQKITLLLYHKQFEVYDLLPETSRKSTGVQMSKGLPKLWN